MYQNDLELDLSRSMTFQIEQRISEMSSTQKIINLEVLHLILLKKNKKLAFPTWLAGAILDLVIVVLVAVWLTSTSVICYGSRDSLTHIKRETLPTPFCERVYRPSTVLLPMREDDIVLVAWALSQSHFGLNFDDFW